MDNFDFNVNLDDVFEQAMTEKDVAKKAAAIEHLAKAQAALLKAQQDAEKAKIEQAKMELEQEKMRSDMLIDRKVGLKDILPLVPGLITAAVGVTTCVATVKSANVRANADTAIATSNNNARLQALQFWKKREEEDLIDDKSLKATNELFR